MKRRYGDNDRHLGPLTFSKHSNGYWRPFGLVLASGGGVEFDARCHLRLHGLGFTLICEMPRLIFPYRRWVDCSNYAWAKGESSGYWSEHPREYGFTISDGFLQVFLGPQTHDSETTQSWSKFLPWTQWRHVRFSLYDLDGNHVWSQFDKDRRLGFSAFEAQLEAEKACPKAVFAFDDYDGRRIQATTHVQEREWRFGDGWFKWLSWFRKPKIHRSLNLEFSEEVGPGKGSWKGGTVAHSIEMLLGESPDSAFRRYCDLEHRSKHRAYRLKYVGQVS